MKSALQDIALMIGLAIVLNLMNQHFEWYGWLAIAVFFALYGYISEVRGMNYGVKIAVKNLLPDCGDPDCPAHGEAK